VGYCSGCRRYLKDKNKGERRREDVCPKRPVQMEVKNKKDRGLQKIELGRVRFCSEKHEGKGLKGYEYWPHS
jgi:hypothetical protein